MGVQSNGLSEVYNIEIKLVFQKKSSTIVIDRTDLVFPKENRTLLNGEQNEKSYTFLI